MENEKRKGAYWEAVRLATEGAPIADFVAKAREAKEEIMDRWYEVWRQSSVLDNLVADLAPHVEWKSGASSDRTRDVYGRPGARLVTQTTTSPTPPPARRPTRADRIRAIAEDLHEGGSTIHTAAIVAALQNEGFQGPGRNLSVAVGNVLARSNGWHRVRPGEYGKITE